MVLGGGGARGAYTSGVLSVLLRELKDQVRVIVGTSAGALVSAYLVANWHRPVEETIEDGLNFWRDLRFGDVLAPLVGLGGAGRFLRYVKRVCARRQPARPVGADPGTAEADARTAGGLRPAERNIREQRVALGVVATPAYSNRSVVFHQRWVDEHPTDLWPPAATQAPSALYS